MAIAIDLFLLPNQLSSGGFSGIGTILYYLFRIPVGTAVLILNVPLFILSLFRNGKKFFAKALVGTSLLSIFLNLFGEFSPVTSDRFLACIYGAVIIGIGTAMVLRANSSTGGSDLLSQIVKTYNPQMRTGTLIVIFDALIIISNTIFFKNIEVGLYSTLIIYIMGKILDIFFEGLGFTKMLFIISPQYQEISNQINTEIRRGTTALHGKGMYTRKDKNILLCVASRNEVNQIRKIINNIDKSAFIIISNAREVYGKGFK